MVDLFEPDVGAATVRLLRAIGATITCPSGQTCCGQPAWNSGFVEDAAKVAATTLDAIASDGAEVVAVPAGSCATMMRVFWPELFELVGDHDRAERARAVAARTKELSELIAEHVDALPPLRVEQPVTVAYHHSCHMNRELRVHDAPTELLDRIEGCERVAYAADERCCGFGGLFSFKLPEASVAMADDKLASIAAAEQPADLVVGCDSSCLLHLRARADHAGTPITTKHLAQVLADALPKA